METVGSGTLGAGSVGSSPLALPRLPSSTRKWLPDPQQYAVEQERGRHDQAMFHFGEYAMFVLLWRTEDEAAGRVRRCSVCWLPQGKITQVYGQATKKDCPSCFGTTFEGGYRAKIVRPSLWDDAKPSDEQVARGEVNRAVAGIQSTSDFWVRTHDFIFRADGTRWLVQTSAENAVSTGFRTAMNHQDVVGYNYGTCTLLDPDHVAYRIEPTDLSVLNTPRQRLPRDWSSIEDIQGPLL